MCGALEGSTRDGGSVSGFGQALMRTGQMGRDFHIIAQGSVDVFREGRVAHLAAGTSVGEMSCLAPSNDLRVRSADVIVVDPAPPSRSPQRA